MAPKTLLWQVLKAQRLEREAADRIGPAPPPGTLTTATPTTMTATPTTTSFDDLRPEEIANLFADLAKDQPDNLTLFSANSSAGCGLALEALQTALQAFGIQTYTEGEKCSILRFRDAPLIHKLRITNHSYDPFNNPDENFLDLNDERRYVYMLSSSTTTCFRIIGGPSLREAIERIINIRQSLLAHTGSLQRRHTKGQLLKLLHNENYTLCPEFAECERATNRGCLLDACMELLTPFGFRHQLREQGFVKLTAVWMSDVRIWRFDHNLNLTTTAALHPRFKSSVVVTGLEPNQCAAQHQADSARTLPQMALQAGVYNQIGFTLTQRREGLVYSLEEKEDREALIERLLNQWKKNGGWSAEKEKARGGKKISRHVHGTERTRYIKSDEEIAEERRSRGQMIHSPLNRSVTTENYEDWEDYVDYED